MKEYEGMTDTSNETGLSSHHGQPSASLQATLAALEDYVAAKTWAEAKSIVETHREQLLSDVVDDVLTTLIARYQNAEAAELLSQYHRVLIHCRVEGIDAAFAELASDNGEAPTENTLRIPRPVLRANSYAEVMELITERPDLTPLIHQHVTQTLGQARRRLLFAIDALLAATSYAEIRATVEHNQTLLTLEADIWLAQYANALTQRGESEAAAVVTTRRWMLAGCRVTGIEAALSSRSPVRDGLQVDIDVADVPQWMMHGRVQTA